MLWKLITQARFPSEIESRVTRRQPIMSVALSTCNRPQPNCKPKCCRDLLKKSVHRETWAPETQKVMFPGAGISCFWGSGFTLVKIEARPCPRATWCWCFSEKKKPKTKQTNQTKLSLEVKPGSADVISSIALSRSNTSHNSRQCHGGPSNLQIGIIRGLLLCQLDNQCLLYYYQNKSFAGYLYEVEELSRPSDLKKNKQTLWWMQRIFPVFLGSYSTRFWEVLKMLVSTQLNEGFNSFQMIPGIQQDCWESTRNWIVTSVVSCGFQWWWSTFSLLYKWTFYSSLVLFRL